MNLQDSLSVASLQAKHLSGLPRITIATNSPTERGSSKSQEFSQACGSGERSLCLPVSRIMALLETLSTEQKLAGVEIARHLDVPPRAVQRVLPSLAIKGHVSREKRTMPAGERDIYVYWLNDEQRLRRHNMGQSRQGAQRLGQGAEDAVTENLRAQVIDLTSQLINAKKSATPAKVMHGGSGVELAEKWHFLLGLLDRPALSDFKLLREIERDYHYALQRARGAD